jgi:hypothetical protein
MLTPSLLARLAALRDPAAAQVYLAIAQHADNPAGRWDLCEDQIAAEAGVNGRTVRRKVPVLVAAGLLAAERTYRVEGAYLTAAEVTARTGGKLVKAPNPQGAQRWVLVRPNRERGAIEHVPVGQGYNRYTLLVRPGGGDRLTPGVGTRSPQGWGQPVPRVGTGCTAEPDQDDETTGDQTTILSSSAAGAAARKKPQADHPTARAAGTTEPRPERAAPSSPPGRVAAPSPRSAAPPPSAKAAGERAGRERLEAYCEALGIDPRDYDARTLAAWCRELGRLAPHFTPEDVRRFLGFKLSNPFFGRDRTLMKPRLVVSDLPAWVRDHRPRWYQHRPPSPWEEETAMAADLPVELEWAVDDARYDPGDEVTRHYLGELVAYAAKLRAKGRQVDADEALLAEARELSAGYGDWARRMEAGKPVRTGLRDRVAWYPSPERRAESVRRRWPPTPSAEELEALDAEYRAAAAECRAAAEAGDDGGGQDGLVIEVQPDGSVIDVAPTPEPEYPREVVDSSNPYAGWYPRLGR